jgi:hypothetical protein
MMRADSPEGQHTCRVLGRHACLQLIEPTRYDAQGVEMVDVEALSCKEWKQWKSSLDEEDQHALRHWRAGVVASPSRQQNNPRRSTSCPFCGAEMASARHLWAECERFSPKRKQLERQFGMDSGWWQRQPKITAKSGWITFEAPRSLHGRGQAMIAANQLGIDVVKACWTANLVADERYGRASALRMALQT